MASQGYPLLRDPLEEAGPITQSVFGPPDQAVTPQGLSAAYPLALTPLAHAMPSQYPDVPPGASPLAPVGTPATAAQVQPAVQAQPESADLVGYPETLPALRPLSTQQERQDQEARTRRFAEADKAASGFLPNALAWTALVLRGDFRPMMQMQQVKQATAFGKALQPDMVKIDQLTRDGKFEEANQLTSAVAAAVGARAPQLMSFIEAKSKRLNDTARDVRDIKTMVRYLGGTDVAKKEHPSYDQYQSLKQLANEGTPLSNDYAKEILGKYFNMNFQTIGERQIGTNVVTGRKMITDVPEVYQVKHLQEDPFAGKVIGAHGIGFPELAMILNRTGPVVTERGTWEPDSPEANAVRADFYRSRAQAAAVRVGQLGPAILPELGEQLRKLGVPPEDIAAGRRADGSPLPLEAAEHMQTLLRTNRAAYDEQSKIMANLNTDPAHYDKLNRVVIDATPDVSRFGRPVYQQTAAQVLASKGTMVAVTPEQLKIIQPAMYAAQTLARLPEMWQALGSPTDWKGRLYGGALRLAQDKLGIQLEAGTSIGKAMQLFADRAIEAAAGTENQANINTGQLKSLVLGGFGDMNQSLTTASYIQRQLLEKVALYSGVDITQGRMQSDAPTSQPSTAAPTAAPTTQPGTAPPGKPAPQPATPVSGGLMGTVSVEMGRKYLPGAAKLSDEEVAALLVLPKNHQLVLRKMTDQEREATNAALPGATPVTPGATPDPRTPLPLAPGPQAPAPTPAPAPVAQPGKKEVPKVPLKWKAVPGSLR